MSKNNHTLKLEIDTARVQELLNEIDGKIHETKVFDRRTRELIKDDIDRVEHICTDKADHVDVVVISGLVSMIVCGFFIMINSFFS